MSPSAPRRRSSSSSSTSYGHLPARRRRRIDPALYPHFAALADGSTWFRNASAVAEYTSFALPAILTGNYPELGRLPVAADFPENLFTLLGSRYRLHVQEPLTELCPEAFCPPRRAPPAARLAAILSDLVAVYLAVVLPDDLAARLPPVTQGWRDFTARDTFTERFFAPRPDPPTRPPPSSTRSAPPRPAIDRPSTSCTCCSRTIRGAAPNGPAVHAAARRCRPQERALAGRRVGRHDSLINGTCCTAVRRYGRGALVSQLRDAGLYVLRYSSSPRTTARACGQASRSSRRPKPRSSTSRRCRCSSRAASGKARP